MKYDNQEAVMAIRTAPKPPRRDRWIDDSPPSPTREVMDYVLDRIAKRGRPPSGKQVVSLRLDPDIIEAFRATGPGWQARINEALRRAKP